MNTSSSALTISIFASGGGTNASAILQAIEENRLDATVGLIVSDRENAGVLQRAEEHNIPSLVISPVSFDSPEAYTDRLIEALDSRGINFIALAGYLKKIPDALVDRFQGRMTNIHPSLLPAFGGSGMYGIRVHQAALDRGVRWSGATVHFVDHTYDTGPILLQKIVPVHQNDTPQSLAARVLVVEHQLYPEALQLIAEGRISIENRKVIIHPLIPH